MKCRRFLSSWITETWLFVKKFLVGVRRFNLSSKVMDNLAMLRFGSMERADITEGDVANWGHGKRP